MSTSGQIRLYALPVKLVHAGVLALAVSILLNVVGTVFYMIVPLPNNSRTYYLSDTTTPALLPLNTRTASLTVVDSDRYGMEDDNDWATIAPLGHGFVKIGEGNDNFYAIAMYHQLHCLNSIRKMLNGHGNASHFDYNQRHGFHCLNYMRQTILCNADIALEPAFFAQNIDGKKTQAAYGTGVTHQCKDWEQIRNFVEENFRTWKDEAPKSVAL